MILHFVMDLNVEVQVCFGSMPKAALIQPSPVLAQGHQAGESQGRCDTGHNQPLSATGYR